MTDRGTAGMTLLLALALASTVRAQAAPSPAPAGPAAATWDSGYAAIRGMAPSSAQAATLGGLVLQRDAGQLRFADGTLELLTPVGGRTMGAVFRGNGTFTFAPRTGLEQQQLRRHHDSTSLTVEFTEAVLLFSDSTLAELNRKVHFEPAAGPGIGTDRISEALDFLDNDRHHDIEPDVMIDLLNAAPGGMFYAYIVPTHERPLALLITPRDGEGVQLRERADRVGAVSTPMVQESAPGVVHTGAPADRYGDAVVRHYTLDVSLPSAGTGDLGFAASARMTIAGEAPLGPWIAFSVFGKFTVDSARWADGTAAVTNKEKDGVYLWVRLPAALPVGAEAELTVYYHGDLIDRLGDFFYIKGSTAWYPRPLAGRSLATFDMTFHYPSEYLLVSVGALTDSGTTGRTTTSHWVTSGPIRNASFNIGVFTSYHPKESGAPPVTVLVSESGHRTLGEKAYSAEEASNDVARSMKLFSTLFGPPPADQFYATEIPAFHGEAFPGLIHLSLVTFGMTGTKGDNEVFRAHEVAHQWWGIGVDFATYHDQWLSEGFANFAGLWYLQTVRDDSKQYFDILDRWRADLLVRGDKAAPIALGYRVADVDNPDDYNLIVYKKGAWVLQMLRMLMVDLKTMNESQFDEMMKDFYLTYRGRRASTADFERMVEKHTGQNMGWFFSQWVYRSAIPTYRTAYQVSDAPDGKYILRLRIRQRDVPDDFLAYMPISIDLGNDQVVRLRLKVTGPLTERELPPLPAKPRGVTFDDLDGVLADVKAVGWDD